MGITPPPSPEAMRSTQPWTVKSHVILSRTYYLDWHADLGRHSNTAPIENNADVAEAVRVPDLPDTRPTPEQSWPEANSAPL